jgi:hypothetical protein
VFTGSLPIVGAKRHPGSAYRDGSDSIRFDPPGSLGCVSAKRVGEASSQSVEEGAIRGNPR